MQHTGLARNKTPKSPTQLTNQFTDKLQTSVVNNSVTFLF